MPSELWGHPELINWSFTSPVDISSDAFFGGTGHRRSEIPIRTGPLRPIHDCSCFFFGSSPTYGLSEHRVPANLVNGQFISVSSSTRSSYGDLMGIPSFQPYSTLWHLVTAMPFLVLHISPFAAKTEQAAASWCVCTALHLLHRPQHGLRDVVDVAGTTRTWLRKQLMRIVGTNNAMPFAPPIRELFIPPLCGDLGDGLLLFYHVLPITIISTISSIDKSAENWSKWPRSAVPPTHLVTSPAGDQHLPTHLDQAPRRFPCLKALCKDLQWNTCAAGPSVRHGEVGSQPSPTSMQDDE